MITLNGTEDANLWLFSEKMLVFYHFLWILAKKVKFWKDFSLSSTKNSKSPSVFVFSFLCMLRKSIFCHGISLIISRKFWHIFFSYFPHKLVLNMPSRFLSLNCFYLISLFLFTLTNQILTQHSWKVLHNLIFMIWFH